MDAPRVSSPLFSHALPSLILAVFATVLFWWNPFGHPTASPIFHLLMQSDVDGQVQLIPDVDRTGLNKGHLILLPLKGGNRLSHIEFQIPPGRLCAFILNGLDRPAEVEIQKCWITTGLGDVAAVLPPAAMFSRMSGVRPGSVEGSVRFRTEQAGVIQGLHYPFSKPIDLGGDPPPPFWQIVLVFLGSLIGSVLLSSWLVNRRPAMGRLVRTVMAWTEARPRRSLLAAAVLSVTLCAFPVIFCGKSYVSPNNGLPLLYERFPTLPGSVRETPENPVGSDIGATMYWHLPASMIEHRAIFHDGEFPLWTRYTWCGVTFFGQLFTMIGDPLHWLAVFTGGASWAWDTMFIVAKIIFALGIGWVVWRAAGHLPVAILCALSAPYIGFFAYRFCHVTNFTQCYAPWLLVAWVEGVRASTHRRAALWAGVLLLAEWCQINGGTAKEALMLLLFLNVAGLWVMVTEGRGWGWRWRRVGIFAWANLLFVLISTPLWLVFLDGLSRAWTPYDEPQVYQIQPGLFIGLFDDIFYRQTDPIEFLVNPSANFFVLLGVAWALVRIRVLIRDRWFVMGLLPAIPAAAFVFGIIPPWLAASIPLIKSIYHFDDTFSCILFVVLFIVAGFGVRECIVRRNDSGWFGDWLCAMALVGVLLAGYFGFTQAAHRLARGFLAAGEAVPKSSFFVDYATLIVAALVLLPLAWRGALRDRVAGPAWALVAACLFATLHFRYGMYLNTKFDLYTMNPKTRQDLRHVPSPAIEAVRQATQVEPARVMGLDWVMTPGFNTCLDVETISGPDALLDPTMLALADALAIPRTYMWRLVLSTGGYVKMQRALDFLNVRYLLNDPSEPAPVGARRVGTFDLNVYESETAWPRAFFTDAVIPIRDVNDLVQRIHEGDGRPFAAMTTGQLASLPLPAKDPAQRTVQKAQSYRLTNNTTSFEVDAATPGLAVLSESNPPGDILAYVDGRPVPCLPVNLVFRGVYIEKPGRHTVKFAYWPRLLGPSLWAAAAGLVALVASLGWWWRSGGATSQAAEAETVAAEPAAAS